MSKKPAKAIAAPKSKTKQTPIPVGKPAPSFRKVASLRDLRKVTAHTQEELAETLGVGQGTVSRIEKQNDMLVSTLQHYIESVGGKLTIVASFPNRPPLVIERLGGKAPPLENKETQLSSSSTSS